MAQILLELDNQLKHTDIVIPLTNSSKEEVGEENYEHNAPAKQLTAVYGILAPMIEVNNIVIDFDDVREFQLLSDLEVPSVHAVVYDKYGLTLSLDKPKNDNELRIQIVPPYDNAYKKINLTFYITDINISGHVIDVYGEYKVPELTNTLFKCLGEMNTYDLFKQIATETKLGFATNVLANDLDKRYIICNYKSYLDTMRDEIQLSGSEDLILDFWVDFWNNINLVDIKERYTTKDEEKDMLIWVTGLQDEVEEGSHRQPILTGALLNNNPVSKSSDLYVETYKISNNSGMLLNEGSDKVYSMYEYNKSEYLDYLILDGDVKKDIFLKHEYVGEVYGDFNYLKMKECRDAYLQKINSNSIKVTLNSPVLALMRGHKVNFQWYINDELRSRKIEGLKNEGFINDEAETNVPMPEDEEIDNKSDAGKFELDKSVSGQYLITACEMTFKNSKWKYVLTLNKPAMESTDVLLVPEENK